MTARPRTHRGTPATAELVGFAAGLVGYNVALNRVPLPDPLYVPVNLGLTTAAVGRLGRRWGLSPRDVGLRLDSVGRGLVVGGTVAGVTAFGLAALRGHPAAAPFLADERAAGLAGAGLAYYTLVRIPLGTAVTEEVLFRGVLEEGFALSLPRAVAAAVSAAAFGLWHIGPTLRLLDGNKVELGPLGTAAAVAGTVAATTLAGVGFSLLRRRGHGLTAPIVAHAGINAAGLLAAVAAQRAPR